MSYDLPEIMTIMEMSNYIRGPRSSLYKLAQEGKILCQKVGRHWRFRREAIDRWLGNLPAKQEPGSIAKELNHNEYKG